MTEANSPYYAAGAAEGDADSARASACPPEEVLGMDPDKAWSAMYRRGYEANYTPDPCPCDGSCQEER